MTQRPRDGTIAFDPDRAARARRFFERVLVHTKGRWARSPFLLADWQSEELIDPIFGTVRFDAQLETWVRAYNEVWLELGRKNGKSALMAGIALYLLIADGEEGAEVYGAAKDRDQAGLVFAVAKRMVELSPTLSSLVARNVIRLVDSRKSIVFTPTDSVYRVIAADADGNLGQSPHGILFDEIIAQPSRDLYDALRTGFGGRDQPLLVCATTAGNDPESFAALEHDEALKVAKDPKRQPNRFVFIRNTPEGADPWDEENWAHANPALGDYLSLNTLRTEAAAAKADPTKENAFRQFRLNQWVQSATRAVPLHVWDAGAGMVIPEDLEGRRAFAGLDLAATSDLAALVLVFPPDEDLESPAEDLESPAEDLVDAELVEEEEEEELAAGELGANGFEVIGRYWVPAGAVDALDKSTGGKLRVWEREGRLTIVDGEVIDYDLIHEQLDEDRRRFGLVDVSLDPWNSSTTIAWAEQQRITAVAVSQTFRALSPPTKELLRLIHQRRIRHGGDPVLRWNIDALELKRDNSDNIRPVKPNRQRSGKRVDAAVALILGIDGYMRRGRQRRRSAYEDRGVDVV